MKINNIIIFYNVKPTKVFWQFFLFFCLLSGGNLSAQTIPDAEFEMQNPLLRSADVKIDGIVLFQVQGIASYTSAQRAAAISERIEKAASNDSISTDSLKIIIGEHRLMIYAGNEFIMSVFDIDATNTTIKREVLAEIFLQKIAKAIDSHRHERSRPVLIKKSLYAIAGAAVMALILFAFLWLIRRINNTLMNRIKSRIDKVENKSFNLIRSNQLWKAIQIFFNVIKIAIIVFVISAFLQFILGLFPWTNNIATYTLNLVLDPIQKIWKGFIGFIPSLVFLIVIFFVTRYLLKLINLLFTGIDQGGIVISGFDNDWAMPTFRILRFFIIAFSLVVAYPYIPGSESSAFKGVTVFIGVLFSLGSSSFISNLVAGYSMTYRGAYKTGDLIKLDEFTGFVEEQKLLVTRLRSFKNEEIVVPNSLLLNSNIVNYSKKAKEQGLILHTMVGIGYETPWRQVDAMLKLAADRTEGLLKQPPPYVLKKSLGDFAVNYEINVFCSDVTKMNTYYSELHQNILDVFNENNVQIMTPSYERDPEIPKVVPKDQWFTPLAGEQSL